MNKLYRVGAYCRLSVDDASNSAKARNYIPADESTKYSTASVNSRLLHVQFRIPVYSGAISSHCLSVKSLGYDFRFFSSMFLSYHRSQPL